MSWVGGMRFVGSADSGHAVVMDAKSDEGPQTAASPMEMVLMALGGCSSVDIVDILRKMRVAFDGVEVVITAERAKEPPRVFTQADMEFVVSGQGLKDEAVKRAVDLSMEKYCSVAAMLKSGGVTLSYKYQIRQKAPTEHAPSSEAPAKA